MGVGFVNSFAGVNSHIVYEICYSENSGYEFKISRSDYNKLKIMQYAVNKPLDNGFSADN